MGDMDERVRVIFQHGPVWERGIEPGSCPPQGLKLIRIMSSYEVLHNQSDDDNNKKSLQKPIPPFYWNNNAWYGTSHTWGPTKSNRLWFINELEEIDAWHERPTGDNPNVWSLRLLGNHLLIQCPRIINGDDMGLFRIAWLYPNEEEEQDDDDNKEIYKQEKQEKEWNLLRIEAGIWALERMENNEMINDDSVVSFYPPRLGSLRCDVLQNILSNDN